MNYIVVASALDFLTNEFSFGLFAHVFPPASVTLTTKITDASRVEKNFISKNKHCGNKHRQQNSSVGGFPIIVKGRIYKVI